MFKEHLLSALQQAFEDLIAVAQEVETGGGSTSREEWGPREVVAHLAGWEIIATVHIPHVVASMPPLFAYADPTQQRVLNAALNEAFITLTTDQPVQQVCELLRRAYQRDLAMLRHVDEPFFREGQYVASRTKAAISHCHEHSEKLLLRQASLLQAQGQTAEAEPLIKRALVLCERDLGPEHPHTLSVRSTYEEVLQALQNHHL